MTHPKALWRRNTKRCPSVTFKIGNIFDIFLYVHWHRPPRSAPALFIIGQGKKKKKSLIHPSVLLILLAGSVVVFLERDIFRCFEVCCQALPSNAGVDGRKPTEGSPSWAAALFTPKDCSYPPKDSAGALPSKCWQGSLAKGRIGAKCTNPAEPEPPETPVLILAHPLLRMVPLLLSNNQKIINYCWFLNT